MISLIKILVKFIESKLEKSGLETLILKNSNYIAIGKQIWNEIDENFRIASTVEEKIKSKVEEFNAALLAKFPELTQSDIDSVRQSIAGEFNAGKQAVLDNSTVIQQLQTQLAAATTENTSLKAQLTQIATAAGITAVVSSTSTATDSTNSTESSTGTTGDTSGVATA